MSKLDISQLKKDLKQVTTGNWIIAGQPDLSVFVIKENDHDILASGGGLNDLHDLKLMSQSKQTANAAILANDLAIALINIMGHINTPIGRRKLGFKANSEELNLANEAIKKFLMSIEMDEE